MEIPFYTFVTSFSTPTVALFNFIRVTVEGAFYCGPFRIDLDKAISSIFHVSDLKPRYDDDFNDRLNRRYSVTLLTVFCVIVTTAQYVGNPIHCWCPAEYSGAMVSFAESTCWVSNTYYISHDQRIPDGDLKDYQISYYQWVPFILIGQAALFYIPSIIWRTFTKKAGFDVSALIEKVNKGQRKGEDKQKHVDLAVFHLDRYVKNRDKKLKSNVWKGLKPVKNVQRVLGGPLVYGYLFVKVLYFANSVGQLFLLSKFLGEKFYSYGFDVVTRWINEGELLRSERFPLHTLCQFKVRQHGLLQPHRFECVLQINLFNEFVFIFVWFWLVIISIHTALSLLQWFARLAFMSSNRAFLTKNLNVSYSNDEREKFRMFANEYLSRDGIFMLRMISKNVGFIASGEVITELWKHYAPRTSENNNLASSPSPNEFGDGTYPMKPLHGAAV